MLSIVAFILVIFVTFIAFTISLFYETNANAGGDSNNNKVKLV